MKGNIQLPELTSFNAYISKIKYYVRLTDYYFKNNGMIVFRTAPVNQTVSYLYTSLDPKIVRALKNPWIWGEFQLKRKWGKYPAEYIDWLLPKPSLMDSIPKVKVDINGERYQWRIKK